MNSLHGLLNCEIGGLDDFLQQSITHVSIEYICNTYFVMHWSMLFITLFLVNIRIQYLRSTAVYWGRSVLCLSFQSLHASTFDMLKKCLSVKPSDRYELSCIMNLLYVACFALSIVYKHWPDTRWYCIQTMTRHLWIHYTDCWIVK